MNYAVAIKKGLARYCMAQSLTREILGTRVRKISWVYLTLNHCFVQTGNGKNLNCKVPWGISVLHFTIRIDFKLVYAIITI